MKITHGIRGVSHQTNRFNEVEKNVVFAEAYNEEIKKKAPKKKVHKIISIVVFIALIFTASMYIKNIVYNDSNKTYTLLKGGLNSASSYIQTTLNNSIEKNALAVLDKLGKREGESCKFIDHINNIIITSTNNFIKIEVYIVIDGQIVTSTVYDYNQWVIEDFELINYVTLCVDKWNYTNTDEKVVEKYKEKFIKNEVSENDR